MIFKVLCLNGHFETLKWLIKCNDILQLKHQGITYSDIQLGFENASKKGHLNIVKFLFHQVNDQDICLGFLNACDHGHVDIVEFLMTRKNERKINDDYLDTGFDCACEKDYADIVQLFLKLKIK